MDPRSTPAPLSEPLDVSGLEMDPALLQWSF